MPTDYLHNERGFNLFGGEVDEAIATINIRDRLLIEHMGGPFAERENNFTGMKRVLDLPCRTGIWASRVAQTDPALEVIGLERLSHIIECCQGIAEAQQFNNIHFQLIEQPITTLPFPDNFFDLVNASYLITLLRIDEWPAFLQECLRITRPGGYVRITEAEWGITSSLAIEQFSNLFLKSLHQVGHSASPDGRHIGIVPLLHNLLQCTGWQEIKRRAYAEDYMCGPAMPYDPTTRVMAMANTMSPIILKQQLADQAEIDALLLEAIKDVEQEDFCGLIFLLTFCAHKPLSA